MIHHSEENSRGKDCALDKERIISEFVDITPITNMRRDEGCMTKFLEKVKVNGVQDPGFNSFRGIFAYVCSSSQFLIDWYPRQSWLEVSILRHYAWNPG